MIVTVETDVRSVVGIATGLGGLVVVGLAKTLHSSVVADAVTNGHHLWLLV